MDRTKLGALYGELAAEMERRADPQLEAMLSDVADLLPPWLREPPVWDQVIAASRENQAGSLRALASGELPEECPAPDARLARQFAEIGMPLTIILDGYRSGHRASWNLWSELIEERHLDPESARELRRRGSEFFFAYQARISTLVAEVYAGARPAGTEQLRVGVVRALLGGEEVDTSLLDHPIEGWHVALVGSGTELAGRLRELAPELDCRLLLMDVYEDPWWAWLGRTRPFEDRARAAVIAALTPPAGDRVGLGAELRGAAGFRESNRQASWAYRCTDAERPRLAYADVALEDLALRDREAAAAFAAAELEPIASAPRGELLLETLGAYFACEQNARATARRLGIHHQTVAQRLDSVGELTGHPASARRAELELALRLRRQLAAERL